MIVAKNLSKNFGKVAAVDSISFRISPGRVVGFLGPNGAGKTTTIRMISGFLTPTSGSVEVDSLDVVDHPLEVRRRIGYLPESSPLYTEMSVWEYLKFRARLFGVDRSRRVEAIETAMSRCWVQDVRRRPIRQLSKGFRQRVALAAAMLHDPPVLILDEPTVGLDPSQIREVRGLIRELAGRHTILLSTHILPEAELTCDEVILIADGRIQAQGEIEELRSAAEQSGRYVVEVDSLEGVSVLSSIPAIRDIETKKVDGRWSRFTIVPASGADDLRQAISKALTERGIAVRELTREVTTLEQLFVQHAEVEGGAVQ